MMRKSLVGLVVSLMLAACGGDDDGNTTPDGTPRPPAAPPPEASTSEPQTFLRCDGATAVSCDDTGTATTEVECGLDGCNEEEQRCNECLPGSAECLDDNTIQNCGDDGLPLAAEGCTHGCSELTGDAR